MCNRKADAWLAGETKSKSKRIRVNAAIEEFALYRAGLIAERRGIPIPHSYDDIRPLNYGGYRNEMSLIKTWLKPDYGTRWLDTVGDAEIQAILDKAAAKGRAKKTVQGIRAAILQLIKYHRRHGRTQYRPEEIEIPKSARNPKKQILKVEHLSILFASDETMQKGRIIKDPLIHAYRLAVLIGIRPGELLGLEKDDWNKSDLIKIQRSINDDGEVTGGKNDNAVRDIRVPALAQQELYAQLAQADPLSVRMFPEIQCQQHYRERWRAYCLHNGISYITPYEMRHTFVSIAQTALPDYLLKPVLGHSKSMDTHGIYGHEFDGDQNDPSQFIDDVFKKMLSKKIKSGS